MPVAQLARLFKRPNSSVLAKMANLDGTRSHGARLDMVAGSRLRTDPELLSGVYRKIFLAARSEGIDEDLLPDFLALEGGGQLRLLGQEELDSSTLESALDRELSKWRERQPALTERETERLYTSTARVGQHVFASGVLANCFLSCVFCGMSSPAESRSKLLVASHLKPWRDSTNSERLDVRNGVAACPTHDRAFDVGLLTLSDSLEIQMAPALATHVEIDAAARAAFGAPPLLKRVDLQGMTEQPKPKYVTWHRERIFQRDSGVLSA